MEGHFELRRMANQNQATRWVPSRFNMNAPMPDGKLAIYNSYSGEFAVVPAESSAYVQKALTEPVEGELNPLQQQLSRSGFLVPAEVNESHRARYLHETESRQENRLHLILLPHENCNFRCVYCYEEFVRNKMDALVREALKRMVAQRTAHLARLDIGWFGGEPLLALDVIEELSTSFMADCTKHHVAYSASITTNGYLLTTDVIQRLFACNIRDFQVTLDGPASTHDQRRKLAGGAGTFTRILENLDALKQTPHEFRCIIRVNYDQQNVSKIPELIAELKEHFAGDHRFLLYFFSVGRWGGVDDDRVPVCTATEALQVGLDLANRAIDAQMLVFQRSLLSPHGSVCYASNPHSFVIGSDGTVYKCTVAFDRPYNQVGKIREGGRMALDRDKLALWMAADESGDLVCEQCQIRPSCQGSSCPLMRIEFGERPCPSFKKEITKVLQLVAREEDLL